MQGRGVGALRLLERQGLLRYYEVADRATRGWFVFGWPHSTAVIRDRKTGEHERRP